MQEEHLQQALRLIVQQRARIDAQVIRVAQQNREGQDTRRSRDFLDQMRNVLQLMEYHRDLIARERRH